MDKTPEPLNEQPIQADSIKFRCKEQSFEISQQELNRLFYDIDSYNEQFSMGRMLSRSIFHLMEDEDEKRETDLGDKVNAMNNEQNLTSDAISILHKKTISALGLSLEGVSGKKAKMFFGGSQAGQGEMRINVQDRDQFLAFLQALTPDSVKDSKLHDILDKISASLSAQVYDHYNLEEPPDEMLQLFGGMEKILKEYERLGIGESTKTLKEYLENARIGTLKEYLTINRYSLLAEPKQSFGPADWQVDMSPANISEHWKIATDVLKKLKDNPKAEGLYNQLREHLVRCIDISITDFDSKPKPYYSPESDIQLRDMLEEVKVNLNNIGIEESSKT